jgi:hypothetical protein
MFGRLFSLFITGIPVMNKLNKRPNMKAYVVSVSNHLYLIWEILTLVLILPALGKRVLPELSHASISAAAL